MSWLICIKVKLCIKINVYDNNWSLDLYDYESCEIARLSFSQIKSWVALSFLVVCPSGSVTSPLFSTIWCFRPYKPYIFWKLMTPTIHWPTDHSPITHTDPQDPPNPPRTHLTWPFLHFKTFYAIQTKYFLKPYDTQYPLTHWPLTHHLHRPTKPTIWPSESRTVYSV